MIRNYKRVLARNFLLALDALVDSMAPMALIMMALVALMALMATVRIC